MAARMFRQLAFLVLGALAVLGAEPGPSVAGFAREIGRICPSGWRLAVSNDVLTLRREAPVWIMGKVSNPAQGPGESLETNFKHSGRQIRYELRLRFVPLLSASEYQKLRKAHEEAAARFTKSASGKVDYTHWQIQYEQAQVPTLFTNDFSIFVERWADRGELSGHRIERRFVDVYPGEAALEIEAVIKSLRKLFKEYPNPET